MAQLALLTMAILVGRTVSNFSVACVVSGWVHHLGVQRLGLCLLGRAFACLDVIKAGGPDLMRLCAIPSQ